MSYDLQIDMGNQAPSDLIMKSSYEAWSINELTYLKAGTWPNAGDTCTAGAGCASDDEVAAKVNARCTHSFGACTLH